MGNSELTPKFVDDSPFKEGHVYIVDVAWKSCNPVHRAILHMGFLTGKGKFGAYCAVWCNNYDDPRPASSAYYLKVVKDLGPLK